MQSHIILQLVSYSFTVLAWQSHTPISIFMCELKETFVQKFKNGSDILVDFQAIWNVGGRWVKECLKCHLGKTARMEKDERIFLFEKHWLFFVLFFVLLIFPVKSCGEWSEHWVRVCASIICTCAPEAHRMRNENLIWIVSLQTLEWTSAKERPILRLLKWVLLTERA